MAIDFKTTTFGDRTARNNAGASAQPKAQYWLNFGYYTDEGTENERFVSLPQGIPLDTIEPLKTTSSNQDFNMFQAARNDLLDQFISLCADLEPGASHVIRTEGAMAIQIRRVSAEVAAPKVDDSNPYARPSLFAVAA